MPLYVLAYGYGQFLLGATNGAMPIEPILWDWSDIVGSLREVGAWTLSLGKPLGVGLLALASTFALAGYLAMEPRLAALRRERLAGAQAPPRAAKK